MSVKTWKREFFGPMSKARSDRAAIEHAIKKYEGLYKKNMRKHGVGWDCEVVADGDIFGFNNETCALCIKYFDGLCRGCPLYKIGECCLDEGGAYKKTLATGDPRPMLKALRRALKALK